MACCASIQGFPGLFRPDLRVKECLPRQPLQLDHSDHFGPFMVFMVFCTPDHSDHEP